MKPDDPKALKVLELIRSGALLLDCARTAGVSKSELDALLSRARKSGSPEAAWLERARANRAQFRVRATATVTRGEKGSSFLARTLTQRDPLLDDEESSVEKRREELEVTEGYSGKLTPSVRRRIHALNAEGLSQRAIVRELAKEGVELTQTSVRNALLEPAPEDAPPRELAPDVDELPLPELPPDASAQVVVLHSRLKQIRADIASRRGDFRAGSLSAMHWRALIDIETRAAAALAEAMPPEQPDARRDPNVRRAREVIIASLTANIEGAEARCRRFVVSGACLAELEQLPAARLILERHGHR